MFSEIRNTEGSIYRKEEAENRKRFSASSLIIK